MKQGLQLRLSQQLAMTPQLQQAIRLLQLSTLELQQEIQQALESNPLLEQDDTHDEIETSTEEVNEELDTREQLEQPDMPEELPSMPHGMKSTQQERHQAQALITAMMSCLSIKVKQHKACKTI